MKRVCFLIGSLGKGGAEKVLVDTANTLCCEDLEISIISIEGGEIHEKELDPKIKYRSMITETNRIFRSIHYRLLVHCIPMSWIYRKYFLNEDYDYEVAFLEGLPTRILAQSKKVNYAWVHTNLKNNFDSVASYHSFSENAECYRRYKRIICVSASARDGFISRFGGSYPVTVRYNLLDEKEVRRKSTEVYQNILQWSKDRTHFVSVGRIVEEKGYDRLVRIAARLKERSRSVCFHIIGSGKEEKALRKQIDQMGLSEYVELNGFCPNPYPYIKNADAFVCSSREEGFSTVVTESLILGTPVITTDCSGMKEQFGEVNCGIIASNTEDALLKAIENYIQDSELRTRLKTGAKKRSSAFRIEERKKELLMLFE